MDIEQAKKILQLYRPLAEDDAAEPLFAEAPSFTDAEGGTVDLSPASVEHALELTHQNPELAAWYEELQAIDAAMMEGFQAIEPPADLRSKILAAAQPHLQSAQRAAESGAPAQSSSSSHAASEAPGEDTGSTVANLRASSPAPVHGSIPRGRGTSHDPGAGASKPGTRGSKISARWLALAASVIIALGAGYYFLPASNGQNLPFAAVSKEVPRMTSEHQHAFASKKNSIAEIREWLRANGGTPDFDLPKSLEGFAGVNCEVANISGLRVSVICFAMNSGRFVHLYVMDRSRLTAPPPLMQPEFSQSGQYAMASWSDKRFAYILSESGDEQKIRTLL